jgi:CspA family cold shock protein
MSFGKVVNYNVDRGFGFIKPDNDTIDVFVHARQLVDCSMLEVGQRVAFETTINGQSSKTRADNVRVLTER